ncbi:hypothetical protein KC926_00910 [Candidatus Kaiserbacteria bacterium]|nr:hypothetical protein [Candidatus Kaiserbacteria bacterium]
MKNFKKGGFKKGGRDFGGRPKFGGNKFGGGRPGGKFGGDRNERSSESFPAVCSECSKSCEVPFKPSSDKPIYCSNCFGKKKNSNEQNDRPSFNRHQSDNRPVKSERPHVHNDSGLEDVKRQLAVIESRLNRILDLINPPMPAVKAVVELEKKEVKKAVEAKPKKAAKKASAKAVAKKVVKKAVVKTAAKKVAKKVVKKTPVKVAKKAPVKKVAKKAVKKAVKKVVK